MREIIFRGKRVFDGKWSESAYPKGEMHSDTMIYDYDPNTVCEYTGLNDKNGKKIFEGDIIVCRKYIEGNFVDCLCETGYVEMKHGAFGLHRKQGYYRPFKDWIEDYEYEVIGNVFDDHGLLERRI